MSLHDLLDELARTAPPADAVRSADTAWRTASRRRRRTRATAVAAVLGLVVGAVVVGTWIERPRGSDLPGQGAPGQVLGIPAQIYSVHPWLPTIGSDPVPALAYVVEESYLDRPVAISVDGSYRYLPGPPGQASDLLDAYAVSADGEHLAMVWSSGPAARAGDPLTAQLFVYDLLTGKTQGPWPAGDPGAEITDVALRPDNQGFAYAQHRAATLGAGGTVPLDVVVAIHLDHWTREIEASGPIVWSPDGTQLLVGALDGPNPAIVDLPAGTHHVLDVPPSTQFAAGSWSPDGSKVAGVATRTNEVDLVVADPVTGVSGGTVVRLGSAGGPPAVGWRSGHPVLTGSTGTNLTVETIDPLTGLSSVPPLTTAVGGRQVEALVAATGLLDTAPSVTTPQPKQSRLTWLYLRTQLVLVVGGLLLVGLVLALGGRVITRRRSRRRALPR